MSKSAPYYKWSQSWFAPDRALESLTLGERYLYICCQSAIQAGDISAAARIAKRFLAGMRRVEGNK